MVPWGALTLYAMSEETEILALTRESLPRRTRAVLQSGRRRNPDVLLVELDGTMAVVKDFAPRLWWVRWLLGRWVTSREIRAYRRLAGDPAVPRLLGRIDALAFAVEHRPGERMRRRLARSLPPGFVDELEAAVERMHRRGVVHLDLRHRSNVLADPEGHPVLIDFASAFCFEPGGWLARWLLPWLASLDRAAVGKWRERLEPGERASAR